MLNDFLRAQAELAGGAKQAREVSIELDLRQLPRQILRFRDEGTLALSGNNDASMLELQVGAFNGNDADFACTGQLANRRQCVPRPPVASKHLCQDLLHDLAVHRYAFAAGEEKLGHGMHVALTVYRYYTQIYTVCKEDGCFFEEIVNVSQFRSNVVVFFLPYRIPHFMRSSRQQRNPNECRE